LIINAKLFYPTPKEPDQLLNPREEVETDVKPAIIDAEEF
jgi:hypothetical protein